MKLWHKDRPVLFNLAAWWIILCGLLVLTLIVGGLVVALIIDPVPICISLSGLAFVAITILSAVILINNGPPK